MRDIPAQLHNIRKTTMGETIIAFRVDELYTEAVQDLFLKKIGTEFVMKLEDVTSRTILDQEPSKDGTIEKFRRQLHAMMQELKEKGGMAEGQIKADLFNELRKKGIDVSSRNDLTLKGLAIAIGIVGRWLEE